MAATSKSTEQRVRDRIIAERTELTRKKAADAADRTVALESNAAALVTLGELSTDVVAADERGEDPSDATLAALDAAHAQAVKTLRTFTEKGRKVREADVRLALLHDDNEIARRVAAAEELIAMRETDRPPTAKEVAVLVLLQAGKPLHYREITRIGMESGMLVTSGKTPDATMNALLSVDITQEAKPLFKRTASGVFALVSPAAARKAVEHVQTQEAAPAASKVTKRPSRKATVKA